MSETIAVDPRLMYDGLFDRKPQGELSRLYSAVEISAGRIRGIYPYQNRLFVVTGSCGSGNKGNSIIFAQEIVPISMYQGTPVTYNEKSTTRVSGQSFYCGIKVKHNKEWYVFTDTKVEFTPAVEDPRYARAEQLTLF